MLDVCWRGVIAEAIGRGYSQITGFDQSNEAREGFEAGIRPSRSPSAVDPGFPSLTIVRCS